MIRIRSRKLGVAREENWFASGAYRPSSFDAAVTYFRQHTLQIPSGYLVASEPFHTLTIDLTRERQAILGGMAKNCRYEIERAGRERIAVTRSCAPGEELERFLTAHAGFNAAKGLGAPLSRRQLEPHAWSLYKAERGEWLSYLLTTRDERRCRVWVFINNLAVENRALLGFASRRLVWESICDAQDLGLATYDFGGVVLDERDPRYGITRFKRSFGGTPAEECNALVIPNPFLRAAYRVLTSLRRLR